MKSSGRQVATLPPQEETPAGSPAVYQASISSMWGIHHFPTLGDFLSAARQLGFEEIELNHQVTSEMVTETALQEFRFSSIHEPCPADVSTEELRERDWLISSTDEDCRKRGVESTTRSIELAHRLGAQVVVVHSGMLHVDGSLESNLRALFGAGEVGSQEFLEARNRVISVRQSQVGPHLEAVKESLLRLLEHGSRLGIRLALENRYHCFDIPSLDEMGQLLDLASSDQLGFMYDVGHAQALDRLQLYPHEAWLRRYASRMIGVHLHDAVGLTDHQAPGLGEIDFGSIAPYLPPSAIRVLEVSSDQTESQVRLGMETLASRGCVSRN